MSYEIVAAAPFGGGNGAAATYSYDPLDDGADCEHEGRLTYGRILRKDINGKSLCVDGRRIFARSPEKPSSHPIIPQKLEEWKEKALAALDDWEQHGSLDPGAPITTADEKRQICEKAKASVQFFVDNVRHISYLEFLEALNQCCYLFKEMYPDDKFVKISTTSLESIKSDRWVEDVAVEKGFLDIPERNLNTQTLKKNNIRETIFFRVDDGMYTGSQFILNMMVEENLRVYVCPFISGGDNLRKTFLEKLEEEAGDDFLSETLLYFINSVTSRVTHEVSVVEGKANIYEVFKTIDAIKKNARNIICIIYHSLMEWDLGPKALPFYFDHKVADEVSWNSRDVGAEFSWMFAGLHLPINMVMNGNNDIGLSGTVFIEGCGKSQGNLECNFMHHESCPSRPQWHLEW